MDWFLVNLLNGMSYGMVLFLIASGMSIVLGAMGITNLAHGAIYMVGAYAGWTVAVKWGATFGLGLLAGGLSAGLVGLALERGLLRHLYKKPNEQVLLTFGFVYILSNLCLWVWDKGGVIPLGFSVKGWGERFYRSPPYSPAVLLVSGGEFLKVYDLDTQREIILDGRLVGVSEDGITVLFSKDETYHLFDLEDWQIIDVEIVPGQGLILARDWI